MKAHELAKRLLELPDLDVLSEGCDCDGEVNDVIVRSNMEQVYLTREVQPTAEELAEQELRRAASRLEGMRRMRERLGSQVGLLPEGSELAEAEERIRDMFGGFEESQQ